MPRLTRILVLLAAVVPTAAFSAGFGIYEQGAAMMGRAGAATAAVNDASAVFYNPAALTRLQTASELSLGGSLLLTRTDFEGELPFPGPGVDEEMEPGTFGLPMAYFAHRFENGAAVGFGLNTPFGLGVAWKDPEQFTGRHIVTEVELQTLMGNVVAAWPLGNGFSVAGGASVIGGRVLLENRRRAPAAFGGVNVAKVRLESDWGTAVAWNLALAWASDPADWGAGLTWRSGADLDLEGDADFTQILTGIPALDAGVAATLPPDQGVRTTVHLPGIGAAGVAWASEEWVIGSSLVFTQWSDFTDIPLDFDVDSLDTRIVEDYEDTWAIRLGAERRFERLSWRLGYYYETAAAPSESVSPILPDTDRHGVTIGAGFPLGRVRVDLYDLALFPVTRSTEGRNRDGYQGRYDSYVNVLGAGVTWAF